MLHTHPHTGRFAPSPSGELHLGNLRTALAASIRAATHGASLILRVDDLDPDRSRAEFVASQLADLRAIGIEWDGAEIYQSSRIERYRATISTLVERDLAYHCFCTRAEIRAAASAPHEHGVLSDGYPGTCRTLSRSEVEHRLARGAPSCLRLRVTPATFSIDDAALGSIVGEVDDFVIERRDGVPAYNLATAVDDSDLHVGEVVRGADLVASALRQVALCDMLQFNCPTFMHVGLVLSPAGERLAKRHGAVTLRDLAERGVDASGVRELLEQSLVDSWHDDVRIDPERIERGATWTDLIVVDESS